MPSAQRLAALIGRHGRVVTLQMAGQTGLTVPAHIAGFSAGALVEGATVQQGDREVRIAQVSLDAAGAARAPRQGDRIVVNGKAMAIISVDARALHGSTAMLVIQARGA